MLPGKQLFQSACEIIVSLQITPRPHSAHYLAAQAGLSPSLRYTQAVTTVYQQVCSRPMTLSLCVRGHVFMHLSFIYTKRDNKHFGYYSSCLPCLRDIILIRITLHKHDRWRSSAQDNQAQGTHTGPQNQYTRMHTHKHTADDVLAL